MGMNYEHFDYPGNNAIMDAKICIKTGIPMIKICDHRIENTAFGLISAPDYSSQRWVQLTKRA